MLPDFHITKAREETAEIGDQMVEATGAVQF